MTIDALIIYVMYYPAISPDIPFFFIAERAFYSEVFTALLEANADIGFALIPPIELAAAGGRI